MLPRALTLATDPRDPVMVRNMRLMSFTRARVRVMRCLDTFRVVFRPLVGFRAVFLRVVGFRVAFRRDVGFRVVLRRVVGFVPDRL